MKNNAMEKAMLRKNLRQTLSFVRSVAVALLFLSATEARAIEGVEKIPITINGKEYKIVVGGEERKSDLYYLKKALEEGDKTARKMFLQDKDERWFFIGDDYPLWLKVNKYEQEVMSRRTG